MKRRTGLSRLVDVALEKWKRFLKQLVGRDLWTCRQIKCAIQQQGDYRFFVCPDYLDAESSVLSFGVGEEISFDLALIQNFGLTVYAFDPTPPSIAWIRKEKLPPNFRFFDFGIANYDGTAKFSYYESLAHNYRKMESSSAQEAVCIAKVYRLNTILSMLQLKQPIDLMKLNIEGTEYEVIEDIVQSNIAIEQIVVAFYHRFKEIGIAKTRKAIDLLKSVGYEIFYVDYKGEIYSFIRKDGIASAGARAGFCSYGIHSEG
ncbi:MAG: FkbM family methyltransferase [Candidatus Ratteibacteria bacterium]|jgi:FkbM family methyltransferase